jgi:hypothetical protein
MKQVERRTGEQKLLTLWAAFAISSKLGMSLFIKVMAMWQRRRLMLPRDVVSHA